MAASPLSTSFQRSAGCRATSASLTTHSADTSLVEVIDARSHALFGQPVGPHCPHADLAAPMGTVVPAQWRDRARLLTQCDIFVRRAQFGA